MWNLMDKTVTAIYVIWCTIVIGAALSTGWAIWEAMKAESLSIADTVMGCFLWSVGAMFLVAIFMLAGYIPYNEYKRGY